MNVIFYFWSMNCINQNKERDLSVILNGYSGLITSTGSIHIMNIARVILLHQFQDKCLIKILTIEKLNRNF